MKILPVFGRRLEFRGEGITSEKPTLENMGIAFGILSVGGAEPEIYLGGHLPLPPPTCNVRLKNTIATLEGCCQRTGASQMRLSTT